MKLEVVCIGKNNFNKAYKTMTFVSRGVELKIKLKNEIADRYVYGEKYNIELEEKDNEKYDSEDIKKVKEFLEYE